MLNIMRRNAGSWLIKLLLSLIVVVFIFYGVATYESDTLSSVATINGESISLQEYRRAYEDVLDQYKEVFEMDSVALDATDKLKNFTLARLVDHRLLVQYAQKVGLFVTDQELIESIQTNRLFFHAGTFDISRYRTVLSNLGFTTEQFETHNREFMIIKKLLDIFYGSISVSDLEISNWYRWYNTSLNFSYVFFDSNFYKNSNYDSEEINAYFNQHQQNYKTKTMSKLRYVIFDPHDYVDNDCVDEVKISQYFNLHAHMYTNEKTINVSHILIKEDAYCDVPNEKRGETLAINITKMLSEGSDFAELARLYSECPSKENGGELGNIAYDSVVKRFAEEAFSMSDGEISSPFRTKFGWHIIKVNAINEASIKSLDEVKEEITEILIETSSDLAAYNQAISCSEIFFRSDDLSRANFLETDWFITNEGPAEFGKDAASVASATMLMKVGDISDVYKFGDCYYIIQICEKINSEIPSFENVKSIVMTDFNSYKQMSKAKYEAESFIATVKSGKSFESVAKSYGSGLQLQKTGFIKRNEVVSNNMLEVEFLAEAFNIFKEGDITPEPIAGGNGFYVACLREQITPESACDSNSLKNEKDVILNMFLGYKQSNIASKLLETLRASSDMVIEDGYKSI